MADDQVFIEAFRQVAAGAHPVKVVSTANPKFARAFNAMVKGLRERDRIRDTFGRYMTQQVSDAILKGDVKLGGEEREVSILIAEITNFAELARSRKPQSLVRLVNGYLAPIIDCVLAYDGVVDHLHHGREVSVIWGAPVKDARAPAKAVACAKAIEQAFAKLKVRIAIGVASGSVVTGNIGAPARMEYTAVGTTVLLAERLKEEARARRIGV
ncbi:MAG TPA: adenylate/guanylate cyclase domain-containing protein, partial [Chloroflexota bacterium]|nr:adenylate/guanylate cyclase domain-containing protein [Chloroflexota bacterium]